jgi:hypothetical protein
LAKTDAEATRTAQGLVDHFNSVLNRTVSKSRLTAVAEGETSPPHFDLFRRVKRAVTPLELNGTDLVLLYQHKVEVSEGHCHTLTYSYRLQRDANPRSWLCRWEYYRKPPKPNYRYPLAHVHVNAKPVDGHEIADKHLPTDRITLERLLLHLIEEWGVESFSADYREILEDSIVGFGERRTDR